MDQAEEEQYNDMFAMMNGPGSPGLHLEQLAMFFEELPDPPPRGQVEEIFTQCDEDEDGLIDADEFINVVEIIKLLKNKESAEIFEAFKAAKYRAIFQDADEAVTGVLSLPEATALLSFFTADAEQMRGEDSALLVAADDDKMAQLTAVLAEHADDAAGGLTLPGFQAVLPDLIGGRSSAEAMVCFQMGAQALAAVRDEASARQVSSPGEMARELGIHIPESDEEQDDGVMGDGWAMCEKLQSRLRHTRLELEAEKLLVRDQKEEIDDLTKKLQAAEDQLAARGSTLTPKQSMRMDTGGSFNTNLGREAGMTRMSSKYSQSVAGDPGAPPSYIDANVEELLERERQKRDRVEREKKMLSKELKEKDIEYKVLVADTASLKKRLTKQKNENLRHTSALALLHKHIANLEKDNEVLKRGGNNAQMREVLEKEQMLKAKLQASEKKVEELQMETWYHDKLDYLKSQKSSGIRVKPTYAKPQLASPASGLPARGSGSGNLLRTPSTDPPAASPPVAVDPSDEEYRVLSQFYLPYQNAGSAYEADRVLQKCSVELHKSNTHHPAYWSAKECARIRQWMKSPSCPDALLSDVQRKKYVHSPNRAHNTASHASPSPQTPPPATLHLADVGRMGLRRVATHDPACGAPRGGGYSHQV
eukprot:TRINITY_DN8846_c0_g2_i1.p1 TRINITY_DN8846_c0_g2~~TRINITY_DN8846_c0_g2_i1.p1  ORF type:complete len:649 (+),score=261.24 TRINITY_DN8846_c0_g2_i1:62-2008(+)